MHDAKKVRRRGRPRQSLPLAVQRLEPQDWPPLDRKAWEDATGRSVSPLRQPGRAVHLSPATRRAREGAWGSFIAFLKSVGDLDLREGPGQRLTEPRFARWIEAMRERALRPGTIWQQIREISLVADAMAPDRDWSWVRRHPARPTPAELRAGRKPIVPDDPVDVLTVAYAECSAADAPCPTPGQARRYRDGLLLALGTLTGIRRKNLAEITIGTHLLELGDEFHLVFDETSVKNGRVLELMIRGMLAAHLRTYLDRHRPVLLGDMPDHGRLWLNIGGAPLAYEAIYGLFNRKTTSLLGRRVNPHRLRHSMATSILTHDPTQLRLAGAALGHRGTRSVSEVYDRSGRDGALKLWRRLIEKRRRREGTRG